MRWMKIKLYRWSSINLISAMWRLIEEKMSQKRDINEIK